MSFLNKISTGKRLFIVFASIVFIVFSINFVLHTAVANLENRLKYIKENRLVDLDTLSTLNFEHMVIRAQTLEVMIEEVKASPSFFIPSIFEERNESWKHIDSLVETFKSIPRATEKGKELSKEFFVRYDKWRAIYVDLETQMQKMIYAESEQETQDAYDKYYTLYEQMVPISEAFGNQLVNLKNHNRLQTELLVNNAVKEASLITTITYISGGVFFLFVILIGLAIGRSISAPIRKLVDLNDKLATGDFTADFDKKILSFNDEVGDIARSKEKMVNNTRHLLGSLQKETRSLTQTGLELVSAMDQTASAMNEITSNIESLSQMTINQAASVTETHATIESIRNMVDAQDRLIENQASAVVQSSSAIEQMVSNINSISEALNRNANSMGELVQASDHGRKAVQDMSEIVNHISKDSEGLLEASAIIQAIANQTNLLAMNAAIEAAHAGEAGKGFAVVADEIRKLAENSNTQGKSISQALNNMKSLIETVSRTSKQTNDGFDIIIKHLDEVKNQEHFIRNSMTEQNAGSTEVLSAIQSINDITIQVKDGSTHMANGTREVLQEMSNIQNITTEIKTGMEEMAIGAKEVNNAMQDLDFVSDKNKDTIDVLESELRKFKV